jgi:hypothetical protein
MNLLAASVLFVDAGERFLALAVAQEIARSFQ